MPFIILLERKFFNIKMHSYYFLNEIVSTGKLTDIEGFTHSLVPKKQLQQFETLYIDLTKSEQELFENLHRTNRKQIKKAEGYHFQIEVLEEPSIMDIKAFQKFYNLFSAFVNTYSCNSFHVNTMNKLKDKNALVITKVLNEANEVLCYRVYISDDNIAFCLYSASHFRMKEKTEEKRLLSEANRYLIWRNILYFKSRNHTIFDMGGLTKNPNIRSFKMEFGGEIAHVYSGYEANSKIGQFILWLRAKKIKKG
ncbi:MULTISPECIES: hypothetical protein [unclassified Viridibacillus]|uniref:BioF2-like acetyltransferase domain-containing protein n=1 Tax=Viridibacillus arenosi FSL R5-213 TaxID=1227360 RepID=W4EXH9_9BACL|nr:MULTISPECIES: hypothetical protein [unclassified Viridibacillus]ETT85283.1 hypothetical protein C176_11319 [Viridibacillus arenosi FSL R5-213]OMC80997.1 hypothetical protein BK130_16895 [Viridibacillus sp. FSL H8-0123]OMC86569.1 hypothetical protein BK128_10945 [Viridibacillus sp. FSL H7-0596]OMC89345.1 hypothetical protein BK137_18030 [Viridibacillus arenosi]